MVDIPIPPPHEPLITPEGRVNDNWYRYWENQSRSVNSASSNISAAAGTALQYTRRYLPGFDSTIPRVDNETQSDGVSMKYTQWHITSSTYHRWEKPDAPSFLGVVAEIAGGGGGGGIATTRISCGGGGCGGGWAIKHGGSSAQYWAAADMPDELIIVVGHGGDGGGWDSSHSNAGADGGMTAIVASSVWDALGVSDATRFSALTAMNTTQLTTTCIMWADGGGGGASAGNTTEFIEATGVRSTATVPRGARAYGGDFNGLGGGGSGNIGVSATSLDFTSAVSQVFGHGGACGKVYDNLWGPPLYLGSGGMMKLAGSGAPRGGSGNAHAGNEGGLFGGGGSGGVRITSTGGVRRGGFGGWGAAEITEFYRAST